MRILPMIEPVSFRDILTHKDRLIPACYQVDQKNVCERRFSNTLRSRHDAGVVSIEQLPSTFKAFILNVDLRLPSKLIEIPFRASENIVVKNSFKHGSAIEPEFVMPLLYFRVASN
ncbi:hypothetical protein GCM10022235_81960 [Kribbella ginsengisoli]|uniref:Uncharacterized protein n=1 Tax=Kribbella ginsengisoli TaxID=363865 RepID=A0ABP6Z4Z9_9ACTN